jgi:hypothetical protein
MDENSTCGRKLQVMMLHRRANEQPGSQTGQRQVLRAFFGAKTKLAFLTGALCGEYHRVAVRNGVTISSAIRAAFVPNVV